MICDIGGNDSFYIISLILSEKHWNVYGMIFTERCTEQRSFLKYVEDEYVGQDLSLPHDNI